MPRYFFISYADRVIGDPNGTVRGRLSVPQQLRTAVVPPRRFPPPWSKSRIGSARAVTEIAEAFGWIALVVVVSAAILVLVALYFWKPR